VSGEGSPLYVQYVGLTRIDLSLRASVCIHTTSSSLPFIWLLTILIDLLTIHET